MDHTGGTVSGLPLKLIWKYAYYAYIVYTYPWPNLNNQVEISWYLTEFMIPSVFIRVLDPQSTKQLQSINDPLSKFYSGY